MTFTRTSSGPSLRSMAREQERKISQVVTEVFKVEREAVETLTPEDTGLLKNWLKRGEITGSRASIGLVEGTRFDMAAPPGTIAAFVARYLSLTGRKPGRAAGVLSWYTLNAEQKKLLRDYRLAGAAEMGGPYPPPVYFGAVEKGLVPGQAGNANVNFVERIQERIRAQIPGIIKTIMG